MFRTGADIQRFNRAQMQKPDGSEVHSDAPRFPSFRSEEVQKRGASEVLKPSSATHISDIQNLECLILVPMRSNCYKMWQGSEASRLWRLRSAAFEKREVHLIFQEFDSEVRPLCGVVKHDANVHIF